MKDKASILDRINDFRQRISLIENQKMKEMEKHPGKRDFRILVFYNRELSVYEFVIDQLEWFLSE